MNQSQKLEIQTTLAFDCRIADQVSGAPISLSESAWGRHGAARPRSGSGGTAGGLEANFLVANTGFTITATASSESFAGTGSWGAAAGTTLINNVIGYATNILTGLQTAASNVATQASVIDIRKDFTKVSQRTNNEFADYLTIADINEEGANLAALQTKQQLAVQALSLSSRADQAILRLF